MDKRESDKWGSTVASNIVMKVEVGILTNELPHTCKYGFDL